ncbi:BCL5p [Penicillium bovifimosum]|uniref:BCL5p n=1 Tax=Penicillium bovifimosum TaxID=126998 RepID=A0A9W9L3U0_9EURO|nr:BCL5p [Penicillium bovifimosum]KAJ5135663.1 BCL5p [Penicillium bovifimosum]
MTNDSKTMENGSESSRLIPLEPIDQWVPINNVRSILFMVIREILNEEAMRDALGHLIRDHLPILGARLEANSTNGDLAYRLPDSFTADYKLFQWSNQIVDSSLAAANLLPESPQADSGPFYGPWSVPELEDKWTPSTWPKERKFEEPDTPLLLVHIVKYTDATVVTLSLPHAVSDQMGFASLITAWLQIIKGETPAEFLQLRPGALDGPKLSKKELRRKGTYRIMNNLEKTRYIMGLLPDLILNPEETRRMLFLPVKLVESLRDRHTQALKSEFGEDTVPLTSGDIVTALLTKFANYGRKSSQKVSLSTAMNGRGRHPALPADKPYLHNCICHIVQQSPNPNKVSLGKLAYQHRLAVLEGMQLESIERNLAVTKKLYNRKRMLQVTEPGNLGYACTNWCGAWRNIDFGPAVVTKEDASANGGAVNASAINGCVTARPLVLGHSLNRDHPTRYNVQVMCKADGGFWCDFTVSTKTAARLDKLFESDPSLSSL